MPLYNMKSLQLTGCQQRNVESLPTLPCWGKLEYTPYIYLSIFFTITLSEFGAMPRTWISLLLGLLITLNATSFFTFRQATPNTGRFE